MIPTKRRPADVIAEQAMARSRNEDHRDSREDDAHSLSARNVERIIFLGVFSLYALFL